MSDATTVITRYIDLVGAHDLEPLDELFADDLVATTTSANFGKAEWIAALRRLLPVLVRNEIREVIGGPSTGSGTGAGTGSGTSAETAAVFYDFVTDTDAGAVPCAEWITVADGRITTVELIFDQSKWSHVVAALRERAASN
jgi:ketosteroid isomerase-like protein